MQEDTAHTRIAGGVIAGLAVIGIIVLALFCNCQRRSSSNFVIARDVHLADETPCSSSCPRHPSCAFVLMYFSTHRMQKGTPGVNMPLPPHRAPTRKRADYFSNLTIAVVWRGLQCASVLSFPLFYSRTCGYKQRLFPFFFEVL